MTTNNDEIVMLDIHRLKLFYKGFDVEYAATA